jgi:hypothetical protein
VSRFERGATVPSLHTPDRLTRALKTRAADLLSESSTEPPEQAMRIAAWLDGVPDRDRMFVVEQIKQLCDHFRKKG